MSLLKFKTIQEEKSKDELIEDLWKAFKKIEKINEEKEKLESELRKYKNSNTPSSQKRFCKVKVQGLKVGRKKGKKTGHEGKTRKKEKDYKLVEVTADFNPSNGNTNIKLLDYYDEFPVVDFKIVKIKRLFRCRYYEDLVTGEIFCASHPDIPEKGIFGKSVQAFASFLRFRCRVPFEKIAFTFTHVFDISMTTPTAWEICNRVANKISPEYNKLKINIQKEKAVNGDETGAKRNGLPGWLWGFFSLTIALFVFDAKRGGDIVEKILGKNFKGVLGCDGWSTYKVFSKKTGILLQRCWAHALRELKEICYEKKKPNKSLIKSYEWLCEIFEKIKEARKIKSKEIREQHYIELIDELNTWIGIYKSYRRLKSFVNKMENGENFWFTCILHLEIEPTNNRAERGLRTWVVLRKIIGCLRSEQGFKTTETMLSLFSTWDLKNINPYERLKTLI